jgi:hypothetical protein
LGKIRRNVEDIVPQGGSEKKRLFAVQEAGPGRGKTGPCVNKEQFVHLVHKKMLKLTRFVYLTLLLACFVGVTVFAQGTPLPRGYGGITLGMSYYEVEALIKADAAFGSRGTPDVTMALPPGQRLLQVPGNPNGPYALCTFHFLDDKLYIITFGLNKSRTDHYSIFTALSERYGPPVSLNPAKSVWDDGEVTVILERPLTLKYVDAAAFQSISDAAATAVAEREESRARFTDAL